MRIVIGKTHRLPSPGLSATLSLNLLGTPASRRRFARVALKLAVETTALPGRRCSVQGFKARTLVGRNLSPSDEEREGLRGFRQFFRPIHAVGISTGNILV